MTQAMKKPEETFDHFKGAVPVKLRRKLLEIAQAVKNDFIGSPGKTGAASGSYGCSNLNEIYGVSRSGYISFQLGGYEVSEFFRSDVDPSYHFTAAQTEAVQKQKKYLYERFRRDNDLKKVLPEDYGYGDIPEDKKTAFTDYENDWFEPALLRFEIWVDDAGKSSAFGKQPEKVYMRVGLNYTDQPYYRSKYDETLFEKAWSINSILKADPAAIVAWLEKKMDAVK